MVKVRNRRTAITESQVNNMIPYQPFKDALTVFKNGHTAINAYRAKYGFSYRVAIEQALESAHEKNEQIWCEEN